MDVFGGLSRGALLGFRLRPDFEDFEKRTAKMQQLGQTLCQHLPLFLRVWVCLYWLVFLCRCSCLIKHLQKLERFGRCWWVLFCCVELFGDLVGSRNTSRWSIGCGIFVTTRKTNRLAIFTTFPQNHSIYFKKSF